MLLIFLSALAVVSGSFLLFAGRARAALSVYEEGLKSVYAAESGANWGLQALKAGPLGRRVTFHLDDRIVTVEASEDGSGGKLSARAEKANGDYLRYVHISYSLVEEDGVRKLKVEDLGSDRN